jgi:2-polyprenyl-3-methyl-5-hydroxy-6-metoxy-1,4-benzoquinol methylase
VASTEDPGYTERLVGLEDKTWKRVLDVQAPYRMRLRRTHPGRTLEVGCGIGRNLRVLDDAVGVDHNADSVAVARARGLRAWTTAEWPQCEDAKLNSYDTLLLAHVLEHLEENAAVEVVKTYVDFLMPTGQLVFVCPQERGYASDATHVRFLDDDALTALATQLGFGQVHTSSFPFPRLAGKLFTYNEFWLEARR